MAYTEAHVPPLQAAWESQHQSVFKCLQNFSLSHVYFIQSAMVDTSVLELTSQNQMWSTLV